MRKPWKQRYMEHLRSDRWAELKQKVINRRGRKCERCNAGEKPLDLHHKHYKTFGNERQKDVVLLCRECHRAEDVERKRRGEAAKAWYRLCGCFGGYVDDADLRLLEQTGYISAVRCERDLSSLAVKRGV